jgi:IDEAL domain
VRMGEWKTVEVGSKTAIGYISNIITFSWIGEMFELTKVGWVSTSGIVWRKPSLGLYEMNQLEPADQLLDQYQDKSTLIDLALLTRDEQWFRELVGQRRQT